MKEITRRYMQVTGRLAQIDSIPDHVVPLLPSLGAPTKDAHLIKAAVAATVADLIEELAVQTEAVLSEDAMKAAVEWYSSPHYAAIKAAHLALVRDDDMLDRTVNILTSHIHMLDSQARCGSA